MKKFIAVIAIVIASVSYAISCDCFYSWSYTHDCGSTIAGSYTYCGYGDSSCTQEVFQEVLLDFALLQMENFLACN